MILWAFPGARPSPCSSRRSPRSAPRGAPRRCPRRCPRCSRAIIYVYVLYIYIYICIYIYRERETYVLYIYIYRERERIVWYTIDNAVCLPRAQCAQREVTRVETPGSRGSGTSLLSAGSLPSRRSAGSGRAQKRLVVFSLGPGPINSSSSIINMIISSSSSSSSSMSRN